MLGNKYLCWEGDAFPDDCFQGGKRKEASLRYGCPRGGFWGEEIRAGSTERGNPPRQALKTWIQSPDLSLALLDNKYRNKLLWGVMQPHQGEPALIWKNDIWFAKDPGNLNSFWGQVGCFFSLFVDIVCFDMALYHLHKDWHNATSESGDSFLTSAWVPPPQTISQVSLESRPPGKRDVKRRKWPIPVLLLSAWIQRLTCQSFPRYLTVV